MWNIPKQTRKMCENLFGKRLDSISAVWYVNPLVHWFIWLFWTRSNKQALVVNPKCQGTLMPWNTDAIAVMEAEKLHPGNSMFIIFLQSSVRMLRFLYTPRLRDARSCMHMIGFACVSIAGLQHSDRSSEFIRKTWYFLICFFLSFVPFFLCSFFNNHWQEA